MPLYEYECQAGHRFETIQRFSDPPLDRCPTCGAEVRKLQSAPAFHLKGSGWYITDYARKDQGSGAKDEGAKGSDASKSSESGGSAATQSDGKSEKKPEPKSDAKSESESKSSTKDAGGEAKSPATRPSDVKPG